MFSFVIDSLLVVSGVPICTVLSISFSAWVCLSLFSKVVVVVGSFPLFWFSSFLVPLQVSFSFFFFAVATITTVAFCISFSGRVVVLSAAAVAALHDDDGCSVFFCFCLLSLSAALSSSASSVSVLSCLPLPFLLVNLSVSFSFLCRLFPLFVRLICCCPLLLSQMSLSSALSLYPYFALLSEAVSTSWLLLMVDVNDCVVSADVKLVYGTSVVAVFVWLVVVGGFVRSRFHQSARVAPTRYVCMSRACCMYFACMLMNTVVQTCCEHDA